ncbi:fasciclin domain-containing protein [Aquimarina agarilytica]|uniref:fasciclin domain-containing protein n=1 Tax=Aquimarina agarilytica TaxID=1087449 RepID=UPI000287E9D5|nr:fasciclin domain-containing protein [Aquimarina agarilytica]
MKTSFLTKFQGFLLASFMLVGIVSCEKETDSSDFENQGQEQVSETLSGSEYLTIEEFEKISENLLEGETISSSDKGAKELTDEADKLSLDFSAKITRGASTGTEIAGDVDITVTRTFRNFSIFRGKLALPNGTETGVRGAFTIDGFVYIITKVKGIGIVLAVGKPDDLGNISGQFLLRSIKGFSRGEWTARPNDIPTLDPTIVDLALATPSLSTLFDAIEQANLIDTLNGTGPFTVFAPTNDAFAQLEALPEGDALVEVLTYHVAQGKLTAADLIAAGKVTTLQGEEITIEQREDGVFLNGNVQVIMADIEASNGIVHVIEQVLVQETPLPSIVDIATSNDSFTTLVGALQAAELVETLQGEGPFTVFAPTNDAFAALETVPNGDVLKEVLLYHVAAGKLTASDLLESRTVTTVQGDEVTIEMVGDKVLLNGSIEVVTADIEASNGIIHVIIGVLVPSIIGLAANPDLSTFVSVVRSQNLLEELEGQGPLTIFAPTNAAFAALETVPSGNALKEVLLNHVVTGRLTAADLLERGTITTLQGAEVTIEMIDDKVLLNGVVEVTMADIQASNGVVHVITDVLIP